MNRFLFLFLLLFMPTISSAVVPPMGLYQKLLSEYVKPGIHHGTLVNWVNYSGLGKDPDFNKLVKILTDFSPQQLEGKNERIAFYINAYNILAMKVVIDNWPVASIKDAGSFFKPVWKKKAGVIGGKQVSLDEIENNVLRPMGDPRIHMSIVCASISCPNLRTEPYSADTLNKQMDDQASDFLSNPQKGLNVTGNSASTSKIFDWFKRDFEKVYGSSKAFIAHYEKLPEDIVLKPDLSYNWTLNGQ